MRDIRTAMLDRLAQGRVISAMENVHVKGMYSLVFMDRVSRGAGMLRMFYIGNQANPMNWLTFQRDFSLLPHNHRQEILLIGLFGDVVNVRMEKLAKPRGNPSFGVYEYEFGSALLNGNFSVARTGDLCYLEWKMEALRTEPGESGILMQAHEIHTVIASSPSAWLVSEGMVSDGKPLCYSVQNNLELDSCGMYKKLNGGEIAALCKEITHHAEEYNAVVQ